MNKKSWVDGDDKEWVGDELEDGEWNEVDSKVLRSERESTKT